jgi:hypothetical protein
MLVDLTACAKPSAAIPVAADPRKRKDCAGGTALELPWAERRRPPRQRADELQRRHTIARERRVSSEEAGEGRVGVASHAPDQQCTSFVRPRLVDLPGADLDPPLMPRALRPRGRYEGSSKDDARDSAADRGGTEGATTAAEAGPQWLRGVAR